MQTGRSQTRSVQILSAVYHPESGPAGVGAIVADAPTTSFSSVHEQVFGSADQLYLRSVLRALQLGKKLHADNVSILCPDETTVKLINREIPLELGSPLAPLYIKSRAMMHTYRFAEVRIVPRSRVEPARRLAIAASRMPVRRTEPQRTLFSAAA